MVFQAAATPRSHRRVHLLHQVPSRQEESCGRVKLNAVQLDQLRGPRQEEAADPETPAYCTTTMSLKWRDVPLAPGGPNLLYDVSTSQPHPWCMPPAARYSTSSMGCPTPSSRTTLLLSEKPWATEQQDAGDLGAGSACSAKPAKWEPPSLNSEPQPGRRFGHFHTDIAAFPGRRGARYLLDGGRIATKGPRLPVRFVVCPGTAAGDSHHTTTCLQPSQPTLGQAVSQVPKAPLRPAPLRIGNTSCRVPLGLRTAPRADGAPSTAEKTYAEPLVVPSKLVTEDHHNPSVQRLCDIISKFTPCKRTYTDRSVTFTPPSLSSTTHVFIRNDAVCLPLTRPYRGPFRVLERNNKAFLIALHGKNDWVSVDRIKPALLEEDTDVTTPHPPPGQSSPQPAPCKKQARGRPRKHPPTPAASSPTQEFPRCPQ
ncbi:uncharacterized protein [Macrobrachium rosenbergii]|uniref:uncharacterized protein n=1 Tax=Macrobrachium rosenbergii TaxID=79674 RepID=UPI0034D64122